MTNLVEKIRSSVIGDMTAIETPFGRKPLVYADYTASGRSLTFIEEYIQTQVLPFYANTHTETSFTGAQSSALREQARDEIRSAVNASEDDKVIFCGSGATAAIHKLLQILNISLPADLDERYELLKSIPVDHRPVVLIGPYEHHSNELPWRESIAEVVAIPLDSAGLLDMQVLQEKLKQYQECELLIGSFSAASNVTGLKTDVDSVTQLLHRYNALAFWDYAAAAPYVQIDMCDAAGNEGDSSKDAVFISPHKFVGGPGTPGVLIVKQKLLNNRVPAVPGGGTVSYVTPDHHCYIEDSERREEGGTPAIVESIRAGLVFKMQQQVGIQKIGQLEHDFVQRAITRWSKHANIEILGNLDAPRLSIISLRIKHSNKDLHYGYVVALLNDLFGIQVRGGCSCAGPYGHSLLGMNTEISMGYETQILAGKPLLRPGWSRINFNYFIDESTFEYLLRAVELVATDGWRLLPFYQYDESSGVWRYQNKKMKLPANIREVNFLAMQSNKNKIACADSGSLNDYLIQAEQELSRVDRNAETYSLELDEISENLRWFVLPQDIEL